MQKEIDFIRLYEEIYRVLPTGDMQRLMDVCYEVTGVPILCVDIAYHLKGAAPHKPIGEYMWDYLLENQRYEEEHIASLYDNGVIQSVDQYQAPYLVNWGYWKDKPNVQGIVKINNVVEAYVTFNCIHSEVRDELFEAMEIIQNVCAYFIKYNESESNLSSTYEKLFAKELFNGNIKTEKKLQKWFADMNCEFKPPYIMAVITANETTEKSTLSFLRKIAQELNAYQILLIQKDVLYMLSYASSALCGANMKKFIAQLKKVSGNCGVSEEFDNLLNLAEYQAQAEMALSVGVGLHPKKHLYYYEEYALPAIILPRYQQMSRRNFIPKVIRDIDVFDRENKTEFMKTLYSYVKNVKNTKDTAEDLHIHRNTLLYRLNKMEELFDIDFSDTQLFLHLMLAFFVESIE